MICSLWQASQRVGIGNVFSVSRGAGERVRRVAARAAGVGEDLGLAVGACDPVGSVNELLALVSPVRRTVRLTGEQRKPLGDEGLHRATLAATFRTARLDQLRERRFAQTHRATPCHESRMPACSITSSSPSVTFLVRRCFTNRCSPRSASPIASTSRATKSTPRFRDTATTTRSISSSRRESLARAPSTSRLRRRARRSSRSSTTLRSRSAAPTTGRPAPRPDYFPGYYAAYVLDPDGYNVEAVHQHR